eukprot:TRINITY_DN57829_c0_g1_i1.p2 TRINITY_DN57829_c0_g1~~TRINITY_DN57829_c0_g1_i1.p2  ORF type:complete len:123 (-),score=36.52 TRINITY_DN57829_c0_g1_i1:112-480(-)
MLRSLVGSEMCIRDRSNLGLQLVLGLLGRLELVCHPVHRLGCLLLPIQSKLGSHAPGLGCRTAHLLGIAVTTRQFVHATQDQLRLCCHLRVCLLYTSDAADEEDSVDLGGRRIIKKKKRIRK